MLFIFYIQSIIYNSYCNLMKANIRRSYLVNEWRHFSPQHSFIENVSTSLQ